MFYHSWNAQLCLLVALVMLTEVHSVSNTDLYRENTLDVDALDRTFQSQILLSRFLAWIREMVLFTIYSTWQGEEKAYFTLVMKC